MDKEQLLHYAKILLSKIEAVERTGNGATIHEINLTEHLLAARIRNLERAPYETWIGVPTPTGGVVYSHENGDRTVTEEEAISKLEKKVSDAEKLLEEIVHAPTIQAK